MSVMLSNLQACCVGLKSDKVTERKKQADVFRALIDQDKCVAALDKSSADSGQLTWGRLLLVVTEYVNKEIDYFHKTKSKSPVTTKKYPASSIFKRVVRRANARGPKLNCDHVLSHILQVLNNTSVLTLFGVDYINILDRDILSDMRYGISQQLWQELLDLTTEKYIEQCKGLDRLLLLKIIEKTITYGSKQTILQSSNVLKFVNKAFDVVKKQENHVHVESFLRIVIAFFYAFGCEYRLQLCKLGESVFPVIYNWWDTKPVESLKLCLMRFFEFQVSIHHPCGVSTVGKGACADDDAVWKSQLQKMYALFLGDVRYSSSRNKKPSQLPTCYLNLIAQTCRQVSLITCQEIHDDGDEDLFVAPKRRKNAGPIDDILDEIKKYADTETSVVWLQILAHKFYMFPDSLNVNLLHMLLTELLQILISCKRSVIAEHLLEICSTLVTCQGYLDFEEMKEEKKELNKIWKQIYDRSLRLFTLNQAKNECLKLMKLLILKKFVKCDIELWCLFTTKQHLSQSMLEVFASYLQCNEMPKCNPKSVLPAESIEQFINDDYDLCYRSYLIHFVLRPLVAEFETELLSHFESVDFKLLSKILVTLCLRSSLDFELSTDSKPYWVNVNERNELEFLEKFYIKSTFNEKLVENEAKLVVDATGNVTVLPVMVDKLFEIILRDVLVLLTETNSQMQSILVTCNYCCLILCVLRSILSLKVISAVEINELDLHTKIEMLFNTLTESIEMLYDQNNKQMQAMQPVFERLCVLCTDGLSGNDAIFIRKLIPSRLIRFLFSILKRQIIDENQSDENSRAAGNNSFDEQMDIEFSNSSEASPHQTQNLKMSDSSSNIVCTTDYVSLCVKSLCAFNRFEINDQLTDANVKLEILKLFLEDNFDVNIPANLQLVLTTLCDILNSKQLFERDIIKQSVSVLRRCSKVYRKNLDVIGNIFDIIVLIIPHLQDSLSNEGDDIINLLYAFWKCHVRRPMGAHTMLKFINCFNAVTKIDPFNEFARWPLLDDSEDTVPMNIRLIELMSCGSYLVELVAAESVANLVKVEPHVCEMSGGIVEWHTEVMKKVIAVKEKWKSIAASRNIADLEGSLNQQSVFLMALTNIAAVNSFCEKKAIFNIMIAVVDERIPTSLAEKALGRISDRFAYQYLCSYLESHFDYLIFNWLKSDRDVFTFPHKLMECESREIFAKKYCSQLIHWSLILGNKSMAQKVLEAADKRDGNMIDLIRSTYFARFSAQILPIIAVNNEWLLGESDITLEQASNYLEFVEDELSLEYFDKQQRFFLDQTTEMLLQLVRVNVKDNMVAPPNNPPSYTKEIIEKGYDYIIKRIDPAEKRSTLLAKYPQTQDILLRLRKNIESELRIHERLRLFCGYKIFVQWVFEELGEFKIFLIRDVIHTLVYFILGHSKENEFAISAVRLLCEVSERVLQVEPRELGNLLSFVANSLSPLLSVPDLKDEIIALFDMLILKNQDKLRDFIGALDPFPNIPELLGVCNFHRRLKYAKGVLTLENEINYFLENCRGAASSSLEGLRLLKKELSSRKLELEISLKKLSEMQRFSEVTQRSIIHQLITELIRLSSSEDKEVAIEATRCLGEIGPIDLYSLVLQINDRTKLYKEVKCFGNDNVGTRNLLKLLSEHLFNMDVHLVEAAGVAIGQFLRSKSGKSFMLRYENTQDDLFCILKPFKAINLEGNAVVIRTEELKSIKDGIVWCPETNKYDEWISKLVCKLISVTLDDVLHCLVPIALRRAKFCQEVFPFVVHFILKDGSEEIRDIMSEKINEFFESQCNNSSEISKDAIKTMLAMINYLRLQRMSGESKTAQWDQNFWLKLNYLNVAKAAELCGANFSALMFLQIWCDSLTSKNKGEVEYSKTYNVAQILSEESSSSDVYELILKTYRNIGDADGCYGFQIGETELPINRIHEYESEMKWDRALTAYSCEAESNPTYEMGVLQSLKMLGNTFALTTCLNGLSRTKIADNEELKEFQYECVWRMGQWNLPRDDGTEIQFNKSVYNVVMDLFQEEGARFVGDMSKAYSCIVRNLSDINLENMFSVYSALAQSQILVQLENYKYAKNESDDPLELVSRKWESNDTFSYYNFLFREPVITNQVVIAQLDQCISNDSQVLCERLLLKSKLAREEKLLDLAESTISQAKALKNLNQRLILNCEMQEARIFWDREESTIAIQKMRKLLSFLSKEENRNCYAVLHSQALGLFSKWLIETKSEIPLTIRNYLNDAITLSTQTATTSDMTDTYLAYGRYLDSNYKQITAHMDSNEYKSRIELLSKTKEETVQLKEKYSSMNMDQKKSFVTIEKQKMIDEQEVTQMTENQKDYLHGALKYYITCLRFSGDHDLRIFRVISLWFQNQTDKDVDKIILRAVNDVSSHKFLPLMHQLAARLSTKDSIFQKTLSKLIEKICSEHPHHSLNVILALSNAYRGEDVGSEQRQLPFEKERVVAAEQMIAKLERKQNLSVIIAKQQKLCDAYIAFSNYKGNDKRQGVAIQMPPATSLLKLPLLDGVCIPTDNIPVKPSGNYNSPCITHFEPSFKLCGGINAPKVLTCLGSDGRKRIQLLKGQDDLRQDAVMQQVFGVVNMLLNQNAETKKKNLHIRTYKVVPLSQRSGVVQWCEGTQPFGDCVISAHARYHPNEFNTVECRNKIAAKAHSNLSEKIEVFEEICSNFHPALHYVFLETFLEPVMWFERIQAYTKSVATSSIVGYILGLGDRHVANILIDKLTAEVIHIDLGVAFEQGKLLPIPEKVPFRLTRDVVDGMGVTGIEGVFRKSCERTLEVLRQSKEIVLTLLEVLLYDPLYSWTLTPEKMANLQEKKTARGRPAKKTAAAGDATGSTGNEETNINKHAEGVLLRLQQKLQGLEGGTSLSVNGQVNYLIKEAINPRNLCALFAGWQSYL